MILGLALATAALTFAIIGGAIQCLERLDWYCRISSVCVWPHSTPPPHAKTLRDPHHEEKNARSGGGCDRCRSIGR
jgi:hypothetical protein